MHINARTLWTTLAAVLVAAVALVAVSAQAQEANRPRREHPAQGRGLGPGRGMGAGPGLERLNLTDQQREQIRGIFEQARASNEAAGRNAGELQRELRAAIFADTPDHAKIDQLKAAIASAQTSALDARVAIDLKIAEVLTPEQRATAREMPAPGRGRGPARGFRR